MQNLKKEVINQLVTVWSINNKGKIAINNAHCI